MSNWLISYALSQLELIIRLLLASICGYVIGHERNNRKKEAGIRTHIIVAIASCLMMEISKYGFADSGDFDGARLAAQVVSGIGMAIGAGMYVIGVVTTLIIVVLQFLFHKKIRILRHVNFESIMFTLADCPEALDKVRNLLEQNNLSCDEILIKKLESGDLNVEVQVSFYEGFDMFEFVKLAAKEEIVKAVYNE